MEPVHNKEHNSDMREHCREIWLEISVASYLNSSIPKPVISDIARDHGVPISTVHTWYQRDNWADELQYRLNRLNKEPEEASVALQKASDIASEITTISQTDVESLRAKHTQEMNSSLETLSEFRSIAARILEEFEDPDVFDSLGIKQKVEILRVYGAMAPRALGVLNDALLRPEDEGRGLRAQSVSQENVDKLLDTLKGMKMGIKETASALVEAIRETEGSDVHPSDYTCPACDSFYDVKISEEYSENWQEELQEAEDVEFVVEADDV